MAIAAAHTDLKAFRDVTGHWLDNNFPKSLSGAMRFETLFWGGENPNYNSEDQKVWFEKMRDKGWTAPTWPTAYGGGGLSNAEAKILKEEMKKRGCPPPLASFGLMMLGPALLHFGTEEQKEKYVREICEGKIWWCQGYSEPGAGSDLASLQTKAEDKGDHYLVNGQKIWTSYADRADKIFCLVRTDQEAPKHLGISFLLIDMDAEGVSTRPIKMISGKSPFCETFFDNVKVPKENIVGEVNKGWTIAKYLLTHERTNISEFSGPELSAYAKEHCGLENGMLKDPMLRPELSRWLINNKAFQFTLERFRDELKAGGSPGAYSSFLKYYATEQNKRKYELLLSLGGYDALEFGESSEEGGIARDMCRTKANSIEGGTSEIQLNIIAKHILGLPTK